MLNHVKTIPPDPEFSGGIGIQCKVNLYLKGTLIVYIVILQN